jgi:hypothetical protein
MNIDPEDLLSCSGPALEPAFAFLPGRALAGPLFSPGARVLASARRLAAAATGRRSLNPRISSSCAGLPECNLFAGDLLHAAGYQAPTHPLGDGTLHYQPAHAWPGASALFELIPDLREVAAGDLLVIDACGGAQLEVISRAQEGEGDRTFITMGARKHGGISEDGRYGRRLAASVAAADGAARFLFRGSARAPDADLYVLRPRPVRAAIASRR